MRTRNVCSMLIAAAILIACKEVSTVTEPSYATADPARAVRGGVAAITAGGGKAQLPAGFSLLHFAFNAKQHADGRATGRFQQLYESSGGTVDFHGVVTCVSFDHVNRRAWVGGVITRNSSTNPAVQGEIHQVGRDVWFRVVDNGEGKSSADRTTVFGFTGAAGFVTSADYCAGQRWAANDAATWAVVEGNLQVLP